VNGAAGYGSAALQCADPRVSPAAEVPQLQQLEDALLDLCGAAQKLKYRIGSTADRVFGTRPEPATDSAKNPTSPDGSALLRIQRAIRALRDEMDGAHYQQDRIEKL
jgi:hypothetical protein